MSGVTKQHQCFLKDPVDGISKELSYCDFTENAQNVTETVTEQEVLTSQKGHTLRQKHKFYTLHLVPGNGPNWKKDKDEAKKYVIVYDHETHNAWPVEKKLFAELYTTKKKKEEKPPSGHHASKKKVTKKGSKK